MFLHHVPTEADVKSPVWRNYFPVIFCGFREKAPLVVRSGWRPGAVNYRNCRNSRNTRGGVRQLRQLDRNFNYRNYRTSATPAGGGRQLR